MAEDGLRRTLGGNEIAEHILKEKKMDNSIQPFPRNRVLAANMNLVPSVLAKRVGKQSERAYSYVLTSVKVKNDHTSLKLEQTGSAPNFQGGILTLCTCKHQMRASLDCSEWLGKWIAGFTSRCRYQGRHWLFYLTKSAHAYESQADLWKNLPAAVRAAKSTREHFLGDVFVPRGKLVGDGRFDPHRYVAPPCHCHRRHKCDKGWQNDIDYRYSDRYGHPSLLVGDPVLTFLWDEPIISLDDDHSRNFEKWESLAELFPHFVLGAS
jgi:hypothetical protein